MMFLGTHFGTRRQGLINNIRFLMGLLPVLNLLHRFNGFQIDTFRTGK
jgi:hypothetical protein